MRSVCGSTTWPSRPSIYSESASLTIRLKQVHLARLTAAQARGFQERVEALVDAIRADSPPDPSTAKWVAGLPDDLHAKLARAGLVISRVDSNQGPAIPLLGRFLDAYLSKRPDLKSSTLTAYAHTRRCLVEYFGATRPMDRITPGDCEDWRRWLASDQKLSDNTVRRRCGVAKQFFRAAVRRRLVAENPFANMAGCVIRENRARDRFITRQEAQAVLDACPDAQWRLLFALSRYGGLRCPSEHLGLRWQDVDWERSRITVRSPKTEHHEGKESRVLPIFPELRPYLEEAWEEAEPGTEYIITRYRASNANLRTQLQRIIRKAGLEPWPKLWHNLRATRETELAETFPLHVVTSWIGNSAAVARKHYLQTTDEHFQRALGGQSALQMALQISDATPCNAMKADSKPKTQTQDIASGCVNSHRLAPNHTTQSSGRTQTRTADLVLISFRMPLFMVIPLSFLSFLTIDGIRAFRHSVFSGVTPKLT